jgi:hypothetical protein
MSVGKFDQKVKAGGLCFEEPVRSEGFIRRLYEIDAPPMERLASIRHYGTLIDSGQTRYIIPLCHTPAYTATH